MYIIKILNELEKDNYNSKINKIKEYNIDEFIINNENSIINRTNKPKKKNEEEIINMLKDTIVSTVDEMIDDIKKKLNLDIFHDKNAFINEMINKEIDEPLSKIINNSKKEKTNNFYDFASGATQVHAIYKFFSLPRYFLSFMGGPMTLITSLAGQTLISYAIQLFKSDVDSIETFLKEIVKKITVNFKESLCNTFINNDNILVYSITEAKKKFTKNAILVGTYTLHPADDNKIVLLEKYHYSLSLEKDDELVIIMGRLGAKRIKITENTINSCSNDANATAQLINLNISNLNFGTKIISEISSNKELIVNFEGNLTEIDDTLLNNSIWFANDSKIMAILESRKFKQNMLKNYMLKNTYSNSFDFDFNFAAKFIKTVDIDLKDQYEILSKKERIFDVEFS
jgi:hypothetical protein